MHGKAYLRDLRAIGLIKPRAGSLVRLKSSTPSFSTAPENIRHATRSLGLLQFPTTMINAVLVFNNNGQPRLTKFYSQLVL
jgi:hypothetical protein